MYDDDVQAPLSVSASDRYYKVAKFPTRNIKTPIVLVYGGSDSLVDIKVMLKELPAHTVAKEVPHFEHLDFLWGAEVETLVFPHVFEALISYTGRDHTNLREITFDSVRNGHLAITETSNYSEDDLSSTVSDTSPSINRTNPRNDTILPRISNKRFASSTPRNTRYSSPPSSSSTEQTSVSMDGASGVRSTQRLKQSNSLLGHNAKHTRRKSGSVSSTKSVDSNKRFEDGGIKLGAGRATTGVSSPSPDLKKPKEILNSDK